MTVTITKMSDGRTRVKVYQAAPGLFKEQRFRLYPPNYNGSNPIDHELSGGAASLTWEFYIEDYPEHFITPFPNTVQGTFSVALERRYTAAYIGSTSWSEDEKQTHTYTIYANDVTKPSISGISILPTTTLFNDTTLFLQGKNGVKTSYTTAGKLGATITETYWYISADTTYKSGNSTPNLINSGSVTVRIFAKDSRGLVNTIERTITVLPYYSPSISPISGETSVVARRVDGNGNTAETGTQIQLKVKKSYASINGKNICTLKYRIKSNVSNNWGSYAEIATDGNSEYSGIIAGTYAKELAYYIEIFIVDSLNESTFIILPIPSEKVYMDRSGARNSIAFGGHVTQDDSFEVYQTARLYGGLVIKGQDDKLYTLTIENGAIVIK